MDHSCSGGENLMASIVPEEYTVGASSGETIELSTGTVIDLPLQYNDWTMTTVAFPVPINQLQELLPDSLSAIRLLPRKGAVVFFSAEYHDAGPLDPYDEIGIMIPALHENDPGKWALSPMSLFGLGRSYVKAYVQYLPVTTEQARSLGEVWGYPKEVAEINIKDGDQTRRVSLHLEGEHVLTFEARRGRTRQQSVDLYSYTGQPNGSIRAPIQTRGQYAVRPLITQASYTLGTHPRADILRSLDIGKRALAQVFGTNLRSRFHSGTRLES